MTGGARRANFDSYAKVEMLTNVVCVELVHPDENTNSNRTQSPVCCRSEDREFAVVYVVNDDLVELSKVNIIRSVFVP